MISLTISPSQGEPARQRPPVPALPRGLGKGSTLPDTMSKDAPESGCQFGLSAGAVIEAQVSQLLCAIYTCIDGETEAPDGARDNPCRPYLLHE